MTKETSMSPTPLEIAAALRSAADFCRDPNSPKAYPGKRGESARGLCVSPLDPTAVKWCAIGHVQVCLGIDEGSDPYSLVGPHAFGRRLALRFDAGDYEEAAVMAERRAREIEASLPVADHAPTRETSTA